MKKYILLKFILFTILFTAHSQNYRAHEIPLVDSSGEQTGIELDDKFHVEYYDELSKQWKSINTYKSNINSKTGLKYDASYHSETAFASFEFNDHIILKITFLNETVIPEDAITIRPLSLNKCFQIEENTLQIIMSKHEKISLELNNRYNGIHLFGNPLMNKPANCIELDQDVYEDLTLESGKTYWLPPGTLVRNRIKIHDVKNVKILGYGVISHFHIARAKDQTEIKFTGVQVTKSKNIEVNGLTIIDTNHYGIWIENSEGVIINNYKLIAGKNPNTDGVNISLSHDIEIDNCFMRTADDCIAIYASRYNHWISGITRGNSYDITVKNSTLYPDNAHGIAVGWHGSRESQSPDFIKDLTFENIDILEQDQTCASQGIEECYWQGAIGIDCGDENNCSNINFQDIRVEDFTNGKLFSITVAPREAGSNFTDGMSVRDITFNNLSYNGYDINKIGVNQFKSNISGLSLERSVTNISFKNFTVNGSTVHDFVNDFPVDVNAYVKSINIDQNCNDIQENYNVTDENNENTSAIFPNSNTLYTHNLVADSHIKSQIDAYIGNKAVLKRGFRFTASSGSYNRYTINSNCQPLTSPTNNNLLLNTCNKDEKENSNEKEFKINKNNSNSFKIYPNPAKSVVHIKSSILSKNSAILKIFDSLGRLKHQKILKESTSISLENFYSGIYLIKIVSNEISEVKRLVIK